MAILCEQCKIEVPSKAALAAHWKKQQQKGNPHFHCAECMMLFYTEEALSSHREQFHPVKQSLSCPGCNLNFPSAGGLVDHIERNQCTKISNADFVARREERLAFARELQRRHRGEDPGLPDNISTSVADLSRSGPHDLTRHLAAVGNRAAGAPSLSAFRPKAENTVRPSPVTFVMKASESQPPQTRSQQPASGVRTTGFAGYPPPPPRAQESTWASHDPRRPGWNARDYFVTFSGKYKCPHASCFKTFPAPGGLRAHLLSPAHDTTTSSARVQCPHCCRWFDSTAALTQHAEAQNARCGIRHTEEYAQFMSQLTAGVVDAVGTNEDGSVRYRVTEEAREVFGGGGGNSQRGKEKGESKSGSEGGEGG